MRTKERNINRKAHVKTIFQIIRDARENDEKLIHLAAGYITALYNEGYFSELDLELLESALAAHHRAIMEGGDDELDRITKQAEEVLLV